MLNHTRLKQVSDSWGATLVKGILANWLVGIATWMANAAQASCWTASGWLSSLFVF
jgi:formate/nitrite transporter FocA (FNT family)